MSQRRLECSIVNEYVVSELFPSLATDEYGALSEEDQ